MSDIHSVLVPLLNVNDDSVVLVEWLVDHGQHVVLGEPICVVQTSKASAELETDDEGGSGVERQRERHFVAVMDRAASREAPDERCAWGQVTEIGGALEVAEGHRVR